MPSIGVIGIGMVGTAIVKALAKSNIVPSVYDKYKNIGNFEEIIKTDLIFVCVPTPTINTNQDISSLEDVISKLNENKYSGVIIIKSTILPGTTSNLKKLYPKLRLAHNPEFLTERNAFEDFIKQPSVIISCNKNDLPIIEEVYSFIISKKILHYEDYRVTETAKYVHNCFLATKISFMNQIYDFCEKENISYREVIEASISQEKIGSSHTSVPGPDGQRGFGGSCFPKDTEALIGLIKELSILKSVIEYNNLIRKNKN
jgi:nucleotide sugar dehydrogenase